MKITKELLQAKNACEEGAKLFNEMYPEGFDISEWTKAKQLETIKTPLRKYLSWAYYSGLIPYWSMSGSDLRDSDLRGSNFSASDLRGSNFSGSDLRDSNFSGSDLRDSNFSGSDLRDSNFSGSNLRDSNFSGSNFSGSRFYYDARTRFPLGFDPKAAGGWLIK